MPLATITNSNFDTQCAAVPAPYGPLTRVDAVAAIGPNSAQPVKVTSALSTTFFISYDELVDVATRNLILAQVHSADNKLDPAYRLHLLAQAAVAHFAPMDDAGWYSPAEYKKIMRLFGFAKPLVALLPITSALDYDAQPVQADFTASVAVKTVTFTNTSTNGAEFFLWEFGNGNTSILPGFAPTPVTHVYATAATFSVRLIAVGPGGVSVQTKSVTTT
jgi:hypothetical protein